MINVNIEGSSVNHEDWLAISTKLYLLANNVLNFIAGKSIKNAHFVSIWGCAPRPLLEIHSSYHWKSLFENPGYTPDEMLSVLIKHLTVLLEYIYLVARHSKHLGRCLCYATDSNWTILPLFNGLNSIPAHSRW